jgi:hypothetical protein
LWFYSSYSQRQSQLWICKLLPFSEVRTVHRALPDFGAIAISGKCAGAAQNAARAQFRTAIHAEIAVPEFA